MASICIRTLAIYFLLSFSMRLMGKRQIGELEVSELVTTLLLSELAAMPIDDPDIPLLFALIPIFLIVSLELITSDLKNRIGFLKRIFESRPSILIRKGALDQNELRRMRMSVEELLSSLRQQGVADIDDVDYAILEPTGKLSVFLHAQKQQPTAEDLGLLPEEKGVAHAIVTDGKLDHAALAACGKDEVWLWQTAKRYQCTPKDIFLLSLDDSAKLTLIKKQSSMSDRRP